MTLELTPEQRFAADAITQWFRDAKWMGGSLTMGGYAGTGKTTLLGKLQLLLPPGTRIVYTSFTGKAVSVLRSKLPSGSVCSTLHRLLYHPRQKVICVESGEEAYQLVLRSELITPEPLKWYCGAHDPALSRKNKDREPCETKRSLDFTPVDNPLDGLDLVIVDEASMVSEKLWQDLTKWGVPVLAVGDHGQLPPVKSEFNLMASPQLRLETILRQAAKSPIIQMATLARTTGHIPIREFGPGCVKFPPFKRQAAMSHLRPGSGDLALCSFNKTRNSMNAQLRRSFLAPPDPSPVVGDIVICLRNSYEAGVFNGLRGRIEQLGIVQDYLEHPQRYGVIRLLDDDYEFDGQISTEQFNQPKTINEIKRSVTLWDYGYAMTVHKSQGSQADRVLVIEERFPHDDDEFHARLLYTAVTRAVRSLCVVGPA